MTNSNIGRGATCPYCLLLISDGQDVTTCTGCDSPHHAECWEDLGGCATYGCPRMVETKKADDRVVTYWGEAEKRCPVCAETIPVAALECHLCGARFDDIRPMERGDLLKPAEEEWVASYRRRATWLVFFSAIGCTSPLCLFIGIPWYLSRKDRFRRAPTARALTLIAIGIGLVYVFVLPLGWVVFSLKGVR